MKRDLEKLGISDMYYSDMKGTSEIYGTLSELYYRLFCWEDIIISKPEMEWMIEYFLTSNPELTMSKHPQHDKFYEAILSCSCKWNLTPEEILNGLSYFLDKFYDDEDLDEIEN